MSFEIDFIYNGFPYRGLATPKIEEGSSYYSVKVESDNQEFYLDMIARPCGESKSEWCFKDSLESADHPVDKSFLTEVGEAIEKYESENNTAI